MLLQPKLDYVPLPKDPFQAIRNVENALGLYISGAHHIDSIPRAADYRDVLRPIGRKALEVLNAVTDLTDYYREQFALKG